MFRATASRNFPSSSRETACAWLYIHLFYFLFFSVFLVSQKCYLTEGLAHLLFCCAHHGRNILWKVSQLLENFHHLRLIKSILILACLFLFVCLFVCLLVCLFLLIPGPSAEQWQSSCLTGGFASPLLQSSPSDPIKITFWFWQNGKMRMIKFWIRQQHCRLIRAIVFNMRMLIILHLQ